MNLLVERSRLHDYTGMFLRRSLLVFIVVLFFGDIAIYLSLAVSPRLQPQYWIALLVVFGGILALFSTRTRWEAFKTPLFFWCAFFFILTLIFYVAVHASHLEQLKERIRDVVLLTAFLATFLMLPAEMTFVRRLILVAVILGVLINMVSLVHRDFLRPPGALWAYQPAGFYINANESGIALILGMVLSVGLLSARWRVLFAFFVFIGVLVTFSREAMIGWIVAMTCLCGFRVLKWKSVGIYAIIFIVCAGVIILVLPKLKFIEPRTVKYYYYDQIHRFLWFLGGHWFGSSNEHRLELLKAGWALFLKHPLIGNGIGSTYHWSLPVSTHNMFLLYMDDYGVVGFFLYPLLIWCMMRGAVGETRKLAWTMAVFLLFWGFFDHNIVQNYYSLFAISLTAAMVWLSRKEPALKPEPVPARASSG